MYELMLGLGLLTVLSLAHVTQVSLLLYTQFYPSPMLPSLLTMPCEIALFFICFSAPEWLLGSQVYSKAVHSNMGVSIPQEVINPLAAGLKYLWPIGYSSEKVRSAWETLKVKAMNQWTFCTNTKASFKHDRDITWMFEIMNMHQPLLSMEETKRLYDLE